MKCGKCPRSGDCPGEKASRVCDLADPDHPDYDPAYHEMVAGPGFWRRLQNASRALVKFLASGAETVDAETQEARMAKCRSCKPYFDDGVCLHQDCGCFLEIKTRIGSQSCPIGEWDQSEGSMNTKCGGCS